MTDDPDQKDKSKQALCPDRTLGIARAAAAAGRILGGCFLRLSRHCAPDALKKHGKVVEEDLVRSENELRKAVVAAMARRLTVM